MQIHKRAIEKLLDEGPERFAKDSVKYFIRQPFIKERHIRNRFPQKLTPINREILEFRSHDQYYKPTIIPYVSGQQMDDLNIDTNLVKAPSTNGGYSSIYPSSNDILPERILEYNSDHAEILIAVGNMMSLDVLANVDPNRIYFMDPNQQQLEYLNLITNFVEESNDRAEFLSNLFGKDHTEVDNIVDRIFPVEELSQQEKIEIEDEFWSIDDDHSPKNHLHELLLDYEYLHQNDKIVGIDALNLGKNTFYDWTSYPSLITRLDNFRDDLEENHSTMPVISIGGFLAKEEKYQHLRKLITQKPHIFIPEAIQPNILHYISSRNPYVDIHLWLSNAPNTGMPLLDRIEYLDNFNSTVNIIPWVDNRGKVKIYQSDPGVHLDAFLSVNKHIQGDTIEVVNVEEWTDSGSSLLNTEMIMLDEFMERPPESDTVFFHILVGHGMGIDKYINLVKKYITNYERVVILEHNSKSEDFSGEIGTTAERLEEALGRPIAKEFTSGKKSDDRNIVLVY